MSATDDGGKKNLCQPWLRYLEDEIRDFDKGSIDEDATIIIRDILTANTGDRAHIKGPALLLDKCYKDVRLRCDLMVRFSSFVLVDTDTLIIFQETIVHTARLISYESDLQDRLIHLLLELLDAEVRVLETMSWTKGLMHPDWNNL